MVTCLGDVFRPEAGVATVRLLRRLGCEVDFPAGQTCCGQPLFNSGYADLARDLARRTIATFDNGQAVVTPSGSCAAMVKVEYPQLFADDSVWHARARELAARTHELSDFLVNVLKVEDVGARFNGKVTYHFACHLRALGQSGEAERLLRNVAGAEYVAPEKQDQCCGFGGSFAVRYPHISGALVADKTACIAATGAQAVVTTDTGCLMNIAGALRRQGSAVKAMHLVELLAGEEGLSE